MRMFIILLLVIAVHRLPAQVIERSVIGSIGASATSGDHQLDYTVGEAVIITLNSADQTLSQGFHQGSLETTGLNGLPVAVSYKIYPNPVADRLWLRMEGPDLNFYALLYNAAGQPLGAKRQVKAAGHWQEAFDLSQHPPGAYFLVITDRRGQWLQSHKVVKL